MQRHVSGIFLLIVCLNAFYLDVYSQKGVTIIDSKHYSSVFGETRNYRVFLPPGYSNSPEKRYPVIYFYHGWSQRFFGSGPDGYNHFEKGDDNGGDNIAAFVSRNMSSSLSRMAITGAGMKSTISGLIISVLWKH